MYELRVILGEKKKLVIETHVSEDINADVGLLDDLPMANLDTLTYLDGDINFPYTVEPTIDLEPHGTGGLDPFPNNTDNGHWNQSSPSLQLSITSCPSPFLNYLQIKKLNFYAARIQNALHIGIPLILAQAERTISPWFWNTQFKALLNSKTPVTVSNSPLMPVIQRPIRPRQC
jgi:hypothetical protein